MFTLLIICGSKLLLLERLNNRVFPQARRYSIDIFNAGVAKYIDSGKQTGSQVNSVKGVSMKQNLGIQKQNFPGPGVRRR